jgi:hypothetical protein
MHGAHIELVNHLQIEDVPEVNWDNQSDRAIILKGPDEVASALKLHQLGQLKPIIVSAH